MQGQLQGRVFLSHKRLEIKREGHDVLADLGEKRGEWRMPVVSTTWAKANAAPTFLGHGWNWMLSEVSQERNRQNNLRYVGLKEAQKGSN